MGIRTDGKVQPVRMLTLVLVLLLVLPSHCTQLRLLLDTFRLLRGTYFSRVERRKRKRDDKAKSDMDGWFASGLQGFRFVAS